MISASRLGYAAALLSLVFILTGLSRMQGSETITYSNRPFLVSSTLGSSSNLREIQNQTLRVGVELVPMEVDCMADRADPVLRIVVWEGLRCIAPRANRRARWHETGRLLVQHLNHLHPRHLRRRRVSESSAV